MRRHVGSAWVDERALAAMVAEATRAHPCETGGVLLGYWPTPSSEVVVTAAIGPGPLAVHEPMRFVPDADYQESEIAIRYRSNPGRYAYLGDWHSHPHGSARLSTKDLHTLHQIAAHEAARAPVPLMAVLTWDVEWRVSVWRFQPALIKVFGFRGRTSLLWVRPFHQESPELEV